MKKAAHILIIALAFASFSFVDETVDLLIPGVGIENYVTINATTKNEIKVKYGSTGKEIKHYSEKIGTGEKQLHSIELEYKKQGVSFYFRPDNDTVFSLHVKTPHKAKTAKGIVLGQSTFQDVEDAYGKSDIYSIGESMALEYAGIRFYTSKAKGLTEEQVMRRKVDEIAIIEFE